MLCFSHSSKSQADSLVCLKPLGSPVVFNIKPCELKESLAALHDFLTDCWVREVELQMMVNTSLKTHWHAASGSSGIIQ